MRTGAVALLLVVATFAPAKETHLRYIPSDTKVVLTIHYPSLTAAERSSAWELINQLYRAHFVPELGKDAKFPLSDISRIVIALPYAGSFNGVILVRGKVDRKRFEQQMQEVAKATTALTIDRLGKPSLLVGTRLLDQKELVALLPPLAKVPTPFRKLVAPQQAHVAALDDETLVVSLSGKKQMERAIRARSGSGGLRVSRDLGSVLLGQDPKDFTVGVLVEDSLHPGLVLVADDATRETFQLFDHITLRINGNDKEVVYTIVIQGKSADAGPTLAERSKQALEKFREIVPILIADKEKRAIVEALLKSFHVSRKDGRVTLVGKLPEAEARRLMAP